MRLAGCRSVTDKALERNAVGRACVEASVRGCVRQKGERARPEIPGRSSPGPRWLSRRSGGDSTRVRDGSTRERTDEGTRVGSRDTSRDRARLWGEGAARKNVCCFSDDRVILLANPFVGTALASGGDGRARDRRSRLALAADALESVKLGPARSGDRARVRDVTVRTRDP